jgi:hypothetical protein
MLLLGSKPPGRNTEQHDVFFSIGKELKDLVPEIKTFWPEAGEKIHIDAWRTVTEVDGYNIEVVEKATTTLPNAKKLFFINLGGYKENEFEEFHYKMITVAADKGAAIQQSKRTAFYKHTSFGAAQSHIDDKYGVDVDDMYEIEEILPEHLKEKYCIRITEAVQILEDEIHMGYFKLSKL